MSVNIKMEGDEKRKRGGNEEEARNGKRSRIMDDSDDGEDPDVQVKVMIPLGAAGAIIGKQGDTFRKLMNDYKATLKISRGNDTYPGTAERVCLVRGRASQVGDIIKFFVETIKNKVDPNTVKSDQYDYKNSERHKEVKLIIPNSAAGYVIGKSGQTIKEIKEKTGAFIQINPKSGSPEAQSTLERIVTCVGEVDELEAALKQILPKVALDSNHAIHSVISYPDGPLLNPGARRDMQHNQQMHQQQQQHNHGPPPDLMSLQHPSSIPGPQFAMPPPLNLPPRSMPPTYAQEHKQDLMNFGNGSSNTMLPPKFNPIENAVNGEVIAFLDNLQATLRASGFNESAVAEIMAAMQVLAKYNIMGLGLGLGVAAMAQMRSGESTNNSQAAAQAAQLQAVKDSEARVRAAQDAAYSSRSSLDYDLVSLGASSRDVIKPEVYSSHSDISSRNELMLAMEQRREPPRAYAGGSYGSLPSTGVMDRGYSPLKDRDSEPYARGGDPYGGSGRGAGDMRGEGGLIKERMQIDPKVLELEVSDRIIGCVLGVGGKNLQEINKFSGAHVEVLPRGSGRVPPGFRQVTITAPTQDAVRAAKSASVSNKIEQEERLALKTESAPVKEESKPVSVVKNIKRNGISAQMLKTVRARETENRKRAAEAIKELRERRLSRLKEVYRKIGTYFVTKSLRKTLRTTLPKTTLKMEPMIKTLANSCHFCTDENEMQAYVDLMIEIIPDHIKKFSVRDTVYIQLIDKCTNIDEYIELYRVHIDDIRQKIRKE